MRTFLFALAVLALVAPAAAACHRNARAAGREARRETRQANRGFGACAMPAMSPAAVPVAVAPPPAAGTAAPPPPQPLPPPAAGTAAPLPPPPVVLAAPIYFLAPVAQPSRLRGSCAGGACR